MKILFVLLIAITPSILLACNQSESLIENSEHYSEIFKDNSICENGVPIFFSIPQKYEGIDHKFSYLVYQTNDAYLSTPLNYIDIKEGAYICIIKNNLNAVKVLSYYGQGSCKEDNHTFIYDNLNGLLENELVYARKEKRRKKKLKGAN